MFSKSLTNLLRVSNNHCRHFLESFDAVITDCDGVLWKLNVPIDGSPEVFNKWRALGKKVFYVTNNSAGTNDDLVKKAISLGYKCAEHEMLSTHSLPASYLKSQNVKKAFVMASQGIIDALHDVGIKTERLEHDPITYGPENHNKFMKHLKLDPEVGAVVVGFDEHISYLKLAKATSYLAQVNCQFIATNDDVGFVVKPNIVLPGTGALIAAISSSCNRYPLILGKPNRFMGDEIIGNYKIDPARTLMIGDTCKTDILFGSNCGFQTLLVLSGMSTLEYAEGLKASGDLGLIADFYVPKLGDLLPYL